MDSMEELVRSKRRGNCHDLHATPDKHLTCGDRYKICVEDIVYEALGDDFFFNEVRVTMSSSLLHVLMPQVFSCIAASTAKVPTYRSMFGIA